MDCRVLLWLFFIFPLLLSPATAKSLADLYARVNPAVVDIHALSVDKTPLINEEVTAIAVGTDGSGVLIDREGTILTASHVVQTAELINVVFLDGQTASASVIVSANWGDIALLKIKDKITLPEPLVLADSDKARIGDQVFVVGAPFGYSHSLSVGYISSRFRSKAMVGNGTMEVFQTDAAMNRGNSGGPLFNMDGEVIGIASHISTMSGGFNGLAFAVTTNQIRDLLNTTSIWSGIKGTVISGKFAHILNVPQEAGLLVEKVATNSWGGQLGLKPSSTESVLYGQEMRIGGDIILQFADLPITTSPSLFDDINRRIATAIEKNQKIGVKILRAGRTLTLYSQ